MLRGEVSRKNEDGEEGEFCQVSCTKSVKISVESFVEVNGLAIVLWRHRLQWKGK